MAFNGLLPPALVILLLSIRLPSFPVGSVTTLDVLKKMIPLPAVALFATISEPLIVQYSTVLAEASLINRMVEVPALADVLRFEIVSELLPLFNPLMVTLSAPLRSISGFATEPDIVLAAPPDGLMVRLVHIPAAPVKALAPSSSVTSAVMVMIIVFDAWVMLLSAVNAPLAFVNEV